MTTAPTAPSAAWPGAAGDTVAPPRLRWWKELAAVAVFYGVYSVVRNMQGSATMSAAHAFRNARQVISLERLIGLYHEESIQDAFLGSDFVMTVWNVFYGTLHFVVTIGVLVFLFRRHPLRYARWRNALATTTALALIGFALYPLMPPRLLPSSYGFVDSLAVFGSPWSFDSTAMHKISNQYAAMPSLHFAWSLWCGLALAPPLVRRSAKTLAWLYPVVTLAAIVITGNHFVIDAVAGAIVLWMGWLISGLLFGGRLRLPLPSRPWPDAPASPGPVTGAS